MTKKKAKARRRKRAWTLVTYAELDAWREKRGIAKKKLAEILGVTNSTYHNWARGVAVATPNTQARIRKLLDEGPDDFVKGVPVYHTSRKNPATVEATGKIVESWLASQGRKKVGADELAKVVRGVKEALR